MKQTTNNNITGNIAISVFAQLLSLCVSFLLGLIVPKFIDEYQYAYWQVFVLYMGYSGIFQIGLLDGIVLRYSQYDYDGLNKRCMRSQYYLLMLMTVIIAAICIFVFFQIFSQTYAIIYSLVAVGIVISNSMGYTQYMFQITNRIKYYALVTIVYRAVYAVVVIILLVCRVNNFIWYCLAELIGQFCTTIIGFFINRDLYVGRGLGVRATFKEAGVNVSSGIFLMIANLSASLLVGSAKMVVQWHWDELVFGKVSFSFSLTNVFLSFVVAVSVVIFPSLKRMDAEKLPDYYGKIRNAMSPLLFSALILYFPMCWILEKWLPNYTESLPYLGILLPLIVYSSKVSLLTDNYFKAYRKEKLMLAINMTGVALGFGLALLSAFVFNDLDMLLYCVVFAIMLTSIVSEIVIMKIIGKKFWKHFVIEILMTFAFIVVVHYLNLWLGCLVYAVVLAIYLVIYRKSVKYMAEAVVGGIKSRLGKTKNDNTVEDNPDEGNLSGDAE